MKYDLKSIKKRKKIEKNIRKIVFIIIIIMLYNGVLLFISYANKTHDFSIFGMRLFIITTESMEPYIKKDDIIITKNVKQEQIKEGDVISFERNEKIITHRVVKINDSNGKITFVTKGDNNTIEDEERVEYDEIKGRCFIRIPKLGVFIKQIENQIVVLSILLVILIVYFFKMINDEKIDKRREKKLKKDKENNQ